MKRIIVLLVLFSLMLAFFTSCASGPEIDNGELKKLCLKKMYQIKVESRVNDNKWFAWTCKDENITFFADSIYITSDNSYLQIFNYITEKGLMGKEIKITSKPHISWATIRKVK